MLSLALAALLASPAHAQDCNAKQIAKDLAAASPVQVGALFVQLSECDAAMAKKLAPVELLRVLPGSEGSGDAAAVAAIKVGATDALIAWTDAMISKDRSSTIAGLGEACDTHAEVKDFLLGAKDRLGDKFWQERWFRALASCSGPEAGAVLAAELDKGTGADKTRYFGILEAYARSQGAAAVPKLEELMGKFTDPEGQTYLVNAFPDAAQVGSTSGMDAKAAEAAVAALERLGPSLTPKATEAARVALQSLDAEEAADRMAGERFRDLRQESGGLLWGVVLVETASCKKGTQTWRRIHSSLVEGMGNTWPDQLEEKVVTSATGAWDLSLGEKCKVDGELKWVVPTEPFADEAAYQAWKAKEQAQVEQQPADKSWKLDHELLRI